ncbi:MAG: hypothetical protein KKG84_00865, partial [Candidatus Omnitrophica bacterium]|nr:hypothetical protein [Candidatus Omnitrophota bacterium]
LRQGGKRVCVLMTVAVYTALLCTAGHCEGTGKETGFWGGIWQKIRSHRPPYVKSNGEIEKIEHSSVLGQGPSGSAEMSAKDHLLMVATSRLETYPELLDFIPKLSVVITKDKGKRFFLRTEDLKIHELSSLDEKTLNDLVNEIHEKMKW